jgi:hypothetical protein
VYTMEQPQLRYAGCDCLDAAHMCMCNHQLVVLLKMFPGTECMDTLLETLGTCLEGATLIKRICYTKCVPC